MTRPLILATIILALVTSAFALDPNVDLTCSIEKLQADYLDNPIAAKKKYNAKYLAIRATVEEINIFYPEKGDALGYVLSRGVAFFFQLDGTVADQAAKLHKGDKVWIYGFVIEPSVLATGFEIINTN